MTVSITTNKTEPYATNGAQTVFYFDFKVLAQADLTVYFTDSEGEIETLTLTTDYTVSGVGEEGGGYITCVSAPEDGGYIQIYRETPQTQDLDLATQGAMPAEAIETRLDKLTMIVQELEEKISRCYIAAPTQVPPDDPTESELYVMTGAADPTPGDPYVEGQLFFNTTDNTLKCHVYTGGAWAWQAMGDADSTYMGLLPRSAGSSYPLSGSLYMGSQQIKALATPTDGTDATTKTYVDGEITTVEDTIDAKFHTTTGHDHDGSDSKKVEATNVLATSASLGAIPYTVSEALQMVLPWAIDYVAAPAVGTSYATVCTATVTLPSASTNLLAIFIMGSPTTGTGYYLDVKLLNGSDETIIEDANWVYMAGAAQDANGQYNIFAHKWTPGSTGSYTVKAQAACTNAALVEKGATLIVLMC